MYDVVDMHVCHLLLGRPWQFDVDVVHSRRDNMHKLWWSSKKVRLVPLTNNKKSSKIEGKNFMTIIKGHLEEDYKGNKKLEKEDEFEVMIVSEEVQPLLVEFTDITLLMMPDGLSPLQDIQHNIDLISCVSLPNLSDYRMSPYEHAILQGQVNELLRK